LAATAAPAAGRAGAAAPPAPPIVSSEVLTLSRELRVRLLGGRELVLEAKPRPGESLEAFCHRFGRTPVRSDLLAASLQGSNALTDDGFYRIPMALLAPDERAVVLRNVFPQDRADGTDWLHVARTSALPLYDEGLWQVAAWFTGEGSRFADLLVANGLTSPELAPGQIVRIPGRMLDAALVPAARSDDGALSYGRDEQGDYAGYLLKPGEALYTAVVLRYTGRTAPEDVEALARSIASRSGVRDVTDIPVGWLVRIPFDDLEPEYLPKADPRRRSVDKQAAAMQRELTAHPPKPVKKGLTGVVVILDPGHGGMDPGTMSHGIWEHDYVFDVATRLKRNLETRTGAKVYLTLDDPANGTVPSAGDALEPNRKRTVLTTPSFVAEEDGETAVAVNLRWYLANSLYRQLVKKGTDPDRIVFLSLHADARHPSLRGAMVYVPGSTYRQGTMGSTAAAYMQFKEVREMPRVSFSRRDRLRSEAVSRTLAAAIVKDLKRNGLPVQPYQPVRDRIIRGREIWLPAVLRGNTIPAKVLIEMVNLNNPEDRALLGRAADRDRLAHALSNALVDYFAPGPKGAAKGK
jgi:N-acetylmuramoyl-L-alanine amidase